MDRVLSHDRGLTFVRFLRDTGPIGGGWLVAAALFGAYSSSSLSATELMQ